MHVESMEATFKLLGKAHVELEEKINVMATITTIMVFKECVSPSQTSI